jgi:hypothetical protein
LSGAWRHRECDRAEVEFEAKSALFIDAFEKEVKKIGCAQFPAQGTLHPDVIESVSFTGGPSVTIKSHHNVGGLPARMNMKLRMTRDRGPFCFPENIAAEMRALFARLRDADLLREGEAGAVAGAF